MEKTITLSGHERYVLLSILEQVVQKHPEIVEDAGDYDIPNPKQKLEDILHKLGSSLLSMEEMG
jgi:hypothetical protein